MWNGIVPERRGLCDGEQCRGISGSGGKRSRTADPFSSNSASVQCPHRNRGEFKMKAGVCHIS